MGRALHGAQVEGAVVGDTAVLFAVNLADAAADVAFEVPASVRRHAITGLVPNARHGTSLERAGGSSECESLPAVIA